MNERVTTTDQAWSNEEQAAFFAAIPKRRAGSGALIVNATGQVLLVEPRYKPTWEIPGGIVEAGEDPRTTCRREIAEELGIGIEPGRLLIIEHKTDPPPLGDAIMFVYEGVTLTDTSAIRLQSEELESFRFISASGLDTFLSPGLANRIRHALRARAEGIMVEIVNGEAA